MTTRELVARAIHAADESHSHEPWDSVSDAYLQMADAVIEALVMRLTE